MSDIRDVPAASHDARPDSPGPRLPVVPRGRPATTAADAGRQFRNTVQREYFDTVERPRMAVVDTPYIRRHVDEAIAAGAFAPGASLLEIGAGLGKGTLPLIARGFDVTANDLSPVLLERLRAAAPGAVHTIASDVLDIQAHVDRAFDGAVGFFVLHHLVGFDETFRALATVLRPGATVAFCEPVAWNPLYYLQIVFTPHMSFSGEVSLTSMRPGIILPAMRRAGFVDVRSRRYGYFPPAVANTRSGRRVEQWLEGRSWIPMPHAFQVFSGRVPA